MENKIDKNQGVCCKVADCYYHAPSDKCTAEQIEVCNCKNCGAESGANDTFCSTYRDKF